MDLFFAAGEDWLQMSTDDEDLQRNWRLQLRLVLVHMDWLANQGWPLTENLDLIYWSRIAFSAP